MDKQESEITYLVPWCKLEKPPKEGKVSVSPCHIEFWWKNVEALKLKTKQNKTEVPNGKRRKLKFKLYKTIVDRWGSRKMTFLDYPVKIMIDSWSVVFLPFEIYFKKDSRSQ